MPSTVKPSDEAASIARRAARVRGRGAGASQGRRPESRNRRERSTCATESPTTTPCERRRATKPVAARRAARSTASVRSTTARSRSRCRCTAIALREDIRHSLRRRCAFVFGFAHDDTPPRVDGSTFAQTMFTPGNSSWTIMSNDGDRLGRPCVGSGRGGADNAVTPSRDHRATIDNSQALYVIRHRLRIAQSHAPGDVNARDKSPLRSLTASDDHASRRTPDRRIQRAEQPAWQDPRPRRVGFRQQVLRVQPSTLVRARAPDAAVKM